MLSTAFLRSVLLEKMKRENFELKFSYDVILVTRIVKFIKVNQISASLCLGRKLHFPIKMQFLAIYLQL